MVDMAELNQANVSIESMDAEFMLSPVPMEKRRSTFSQLMVWIGFGYVVTGLYVGGVLAGFGNQPGVPFSTAILAIALGMGSLQLITFFLGVIAQRTGLNLALLSRYSYGAKGIVIPMAVMALLTFGWFASIVGMIGDIWGGFLGNPSGVIVIDPASMGFSGISPITLEVFLACWFWGLVFTVTAAMGIKAIEAIATPISPVILVIALFVGSKMMSEGGGWGAFIAKSNQLGGLGLGKAITVVVGSWIAGAVMGVDLFRFNKSVKAVFWCAASCFIFTNPLLNIVGYIGVVQVGQFNYSQWMLGISFFFALIGVIAWTASLWTTDNGELYCNSLYTGPALDAFGIKANRKVLVVICGVLGTFLGAMAFYQIFFANFINALGAVAPPLCAPILADYFIISKDKKKYNLDFLHRQPAVRWAGIISFAIGGLLGYIFEYVAPLPFGLPSGLVAMAIAFIIYGLIYKFTPDRAADEALIAETV
jgi:cytosine permease